MKSVWDVEQRFVQTLDSIIDVMVKRNLGGKHVVPLFNMRMRLFFRLPRGTQQRIPTPWYLSTPDAQKGGTDA